MALTTTQRRALRKLNNAFEHIRPRMAADWNGQCPNAEAIAGSMLAAAMCQVVAGRPANHDLQR